MALCQRLDSVGVVLSAGESFGLSSKHAEIGSESFGVVVGMFVGTVPDILGLVWPIFRPNSDPKSKISIRIFKSFWGHFSSAESLRKTLPHKTSPVNGAVATVGRQASCFAVPVHISILAGEA